MEIYAHEVVQNIRHYHGDMIQKVWKNTKVKLFISTDAENLMAVNEVVSSKNP